MLNQNWMISDQNIKMSHKFPDQPYAWRYVMDGVSYKDSIVIGLIEEHLTIKLFNFDWFFETAQEGDPYFLHEGEIDVDSDAWEIYCHTDAFFYKLDAKGQVVLIWESYHISDIPLLSQIPSEILDLEELKYLYLSCSKRAIQKLPDCFKASDRFKTKSVFESFSFKDVKKEFYYFEMIENNTYHRLLEYFKKPYFKKYPHEGVESNRNKANYVLHVYGYDKFKK